MGCLLSRGGIAHCGAGEPESVDSDQRPRHPLGYARGFFVAFRFDRHFPRELNSTVDRLDVLQHEATADPCADFHRRGEAHAVEADVDPHPTRLDRDRRVHQLGQQRQRQQSVRDGAAERRLARRAFRIDVDPLAIVGRNGKVVDALLVAGPPLGDGDLGADFRCEIARGIEITMAFDARRY